MVTPTKTLKNSKEFTRRKSASSKLRSPRKQKQHILEVSVGLQGISLSVFDSVPAELIHLTLQGISISYSDTGEDFITEASIHRIQLDNQLPGGVEVILQPTPLPPETAGCGQPFIQFILVRHKHIGASHYRHFEVLVQEMELNLEEAFLRRWYEFAVRYEKCTS